MSQCCEAQSEPFTCQVIPTFVVLLGAENDHRKHKAEHKGRKYSLMVRPLLSVCFAPFVFRFVLSVGDWHWFCACAASWFRSSQLSQRGWVRPGFRASRLPGFWGDL